jgi:hypothetical protein
MTAMPQSPFLSADQYPLPAETAAADASPQAAAEVIPEPSSNEGRLQGAPAFDAEPFDVGATDHIHEIFHHARKLMDHRFVLDEQAFMEAIEPPPLFLQRTA